MTAQRICAYILYYVGFFGFVAYISILNAFKNKIAAYIFQQDLKINNQIIPSKILFRTEILGLGFLLLIVIGLAIGQQRQWYPPVFLAAIVCTFIGIQIFKESRQKLILDGDYVHIIAFQNEKKYLRSEIRSVQWKSCRGITAKQLIIIFFDGTSYSFNMDCFRGVQNAYNELCNQIEYS